MYFTVYRTVNKLNGKIYIGKHQTNNLDDNYLGSGKMLKHAIEKYGIEHFTKEILFVFDNETEMNAKEAELVDLDFVLREDTYNICFGGHGGWGYFNSNSELQKDKNRRGLEKLKTLRQDENWVEQFSNKVSIGNKISYKNGREKSGFAGDINIRLEMQRRSTLPEAIEKKKKKLAEIKHQQGSKNSQYGTMWIYNKVESKRIKKTDIIPEGWNKGRKIKF